MSTDMVSGRELLRMAYEGLARECDYPMLPLGMDGSAILIDGPLAMVMILHDAVYSPGDAIVFTGVDTDGRKISEIGGAIERSIRSGQRRDAIYLSGIGTLMAAPGFPYAFVISETIDGANGSCVFGGDSAMFPAAHASDLTMALRRAAKMVQTGDPIDEPDYDIGDLDCFCQEGV